jgi:hypothetical protein
MFIFTRFFILLFLILMGSSCHQVMDDDTEYLKWINESSHGLVQKKLVGDVELQALFLPPDLLAWKELKGKAYSKQSWDSLSASYGKSLNFSLSIGIKAEKGDASQDILYRGITSEVDFKKRVHELNFGIERAVRLVVKDKDYYPVLAVMESSYGSQGIRKFYIVFSAEDKASLSKDWQEADLIFTDEWFETGINHFRFKRSAIESVVDFYCSKESK